MPSADIAEPPRVEGNGSGLGSTLGGAVVNGALDGVESSRFAIPTRELQERYAPASVNLQPDFDRVVMAANAQLFKTNKAGQWEGTVGGLATGVAPVMRALRGSVAVSADPTQSLATFGEWVDRPFDAKGVAVHQAEYDAYYGKYCNGTIWPALHGLPEHAVEADSVGWSNYCRVNKKFADSIASQLKPESLAWIHDYHLMLVPNMIRQDNPAANLAYFHHIPWPEPQTLLSDTPGQSKKLPREQLKLIVEGLLGCDLIAFHTMQYVTNFLDTVEEIGFDEADLQVHHSSNTITFKGRTISVGAFPISVDADAIEKVSPITTTHDGKPIKRTAAEEARAETVLGYHDALKARYPGEKIFFGIERLDYTKGIAERLEAIGDLLNDHPELKGTFRFVQVAPSSRDSIVEYQRARALALDTAKRINEKCGTSTWWPIEFYVEEKIPVDGKPGEFEGRLSPQSSRPAAAAGRPMYIEPKASIPPEAVYGYAHAADVLIVTPKRDGMNLVIKEFVAAARPETAFVLGKGAGAAEELRDAILVDGARASSIARGIHQGLKMLETDPQAAAEITARLKHRVFSYPIAAWGAEIMDASAEARDRRNESPLWHPSGGILERQATGLIEASAPHRLLQPARPVYSDVRVLAAQLDELPFVDICCDYDGCAVPIVAQPEWARLDRAGVENISATAHAPSTRFSFVSGRSVPQLLDLLGPLTRQNPPPPILLCGMHGGEIYDLEKGEYLRKLDPSLKDGVAAFKAALSAELERQGLPVSDEMFSDSFRLEDKGFSVALHFRNVPAPTDGRTVEEVATAVVQSVFERGSYGDFEIREGKKVLEFVPQSCSKGSAVEFIAALPARDAQNGIVPQERRHFVALGDDRTDESMFRAVQKLDSRGVTVHIGDLSVETAAHNRLPNPEQVHDLLSSYRFHRLNGALN